MLVAASSNTTTTLLGARRTPSEASAAGKLQLITTNNTATTTSSTTSSSSSAQRSSSRSPVASLCVRISRDTNGFKALLNKIPSEPTTDISVVGLKKTPLFTINPTITHRCPQILDIHSRDSLVADMCIFDPINPVPLTPYVRWVYVASYIAPVLWCFEVVSFRNLLRKNQMNPQTQRKLWKYNKDL